jgi:4-amino-4-deoxy-L-arabinose transferase-like glycosyltransferase
LAEPNPLSKVCSALVALPSLILYLLLFVGVALSHATLLHLPYFWDEGGYYIPAALDFYHHGWLIPHFTNAHPPLPNVVLGSLWHLFGFHILTTRLIVCAFAAAGLLAVLRLTERLLGASAAVAATLMTAVYPIWFAQSTLAHADIFAAAFTLWSLYIYFTREAVEKPELPESRTLVSVAVLFSLAALSKETAILQPAALGALELWLLVRNWSDARLRRDHLRWIAALAAPLLPLVCWYIYHHFATGFTFGNPEYLRYNATANFTVGHVFTSVRYRFLHLFWQRNIWLPIVITIACFFLPKREDRGTTLSPADRGELAGVLGAGWRAAYALPSAGVSADPATVRRYVASSDVSVAGVCRDYRCGLCKCSVAESADVVCAGGQPDLSRHDRGASGSD